MLSNLNPIPQRPQQQSLRQEYADFLEQHVEEYKERLSRTELLAVADEAVRELDLAGDEQLVLTEVLILEHVDRLIKQRLKLPTFRRWRNQHLRRRQAQRDPAHWGLHPELPLADLALPLEESNQALVLGREALPSGLFLAARDWRVLFIDQQLANVEAAEARAAKEGLAPRFQALVVRIGRWFPDVSPALAVLDPAALHGLDESTRDRVLNVFKDRTVSGGLHCLLPTAPARAGFPISTTAFQGYYADWRTRRHPPSRWLVAEKP